jgi:hypothetical protein
MIDPALIRTSVLDALRAVPQLTVFDGAVPEKVPTDSTGHIRPYVAVYAGAPVGLAETGLCSRPDTDSVTRWVQTSLVAASPGHLDSLSTQVAGALTGLRVGSHHLAPDREQHATTVPLPDQSITPTRYVLPLLWGITTT